MRKWLALPIVLLLAPIVLLLEAIERITHPGPVDDSFWPWFKTTYLSASR